MVYVCGTGTTGCHGWIEEHPNDAGKEGFHVRPWEHPDEVPVKYNRSTWFLLLEDGDVNESGQREEDDMAADGGELLPTEEYELSTTSEVPTQEHPE